MPCAVGVTGARVGWLAHGLTSWHVCHHRIRGGVRGGQRPGAAGEGDQHRRRKPPWRSAAAATSSPPPCPRTPATARRTTGPCVRS